MKESNVGIDIMKFIAALLITNSHMDALYGTYSALSTGGAIGDAAFFFISGYTLFLGATPRFDNWYKRRVNRIYPTVFAWALLSCIFFGKHKDMLTIGLYGGGWFVTCIMIYYLFMYPIKRYLKEHLWKVFTIVAVIVLLVYCFGGYKSAELYNAAPFFNINWAGYFLFMLFGAIVGLRWKSVRCEKPWLDMIMLAGSVVLFYGTQYACIKFCPSIPQLKVISVAPLFGVIYFLYKICNSRALVSLYNKNVWGGIIKFVGALCLEIYIVQFSLFTTKMNGIFPLNIPIMFLIIIFVAYVLRCFARLFSQTFKDGDYDWKEIVRLI